MADIFVSYSRQDKARAAQFVELLEGFGWNVFWDQETRAGTIWPKVLEDELGLARCLLVLWTTNSVASRWVRIEAYEALQGDKLLPVRLEDVKPPMEFRQTQTFDLLGWAGERDDPRLDHLIADLCSLAKLEPRKGTIGPATLNAVRTLVPATLGVSTWQAPGTLPGAPDFSGQHAPTYRSVGVAVPTLTPHTQEPSRAERTTRAETLPFVDTQVVKSEAAPTAAPGSRASENDVQTVNTAGANAATAAAAIASDRLRRRAAWGLGFAVVVLAGVWIARTMVGPDKAPIKDDPFKPAMTADVPAPNKSTAVVTEPAPPTIITTPPVTAAKPTTSVARPHSPSSRCIEITERFQQTGQLTAEERQFLSSKECAR